MLNRPKFENSIKNEAFRTLLKRVIAPVIVAAFCMGTSAQAQQGVPDIPQQQQPQVQEPQQVANATQNNDSRLGVDSFDTIDVAEDNRNDIQFVGQNPPDVEAPDFVGGATNGGGNSQGFTGVASNANTTGVNIVRRSVRARLMPSFYAPMIDSQQIPARFRNRFVRQPGSNSVGGQYSIVVENRTAYLRGQVNSPIDSQRLERQLRLEPGIYGIVNELQVMQPVNAISPSLPRSSQPAVISQPVIGQPVPQVMPSPSAIQAPVPQ